jgi:hypothetical protein
MRWLVRDFGIFVYGCAFACKYFVFGRGPSQPGKDLLKARSVFEYDGDDLVRSGLVNSLMLAIRVRNKLG